MGAKVVSRFGKNLRELRQGAGLTQEELGARAGIQMADISRLEAGKRDARLTTVARLADALGVTPPRMLAPRSDES